MDEQNITPTETLNQGAPDLHVPTTEPTPNPQKNKKFALTRKRNIIISVIIIVIIAAFVFYTYAIFGGGPKVFLRQAKGFPGINSPAIQSARSQAQDKVNLATNKLVSFAGSSSIIMPQQYQDMCIKGEHNKIFKLFGQGNDDFAFSCEIYTETIIATSMQECSIAQLLYANNIPFGSNDCPSSGAQVGEKDIGVNNQLGSSQVSVGTKNHYIQYFQAGVNTIQKCYAPTNMVVYCDTKHTNAGTIQNKIKSMPAQYQTIIEYAVTAVYYTK